MQILYGAMPDHEIITTKQLEHIEEVKKKREKMSKEAKIAFEMSQKPKTSETNYISQGLKDTNMALR